MLTALRQRWDVILIFLSGLILFTWNLSAQEITGFDSRFYLFAQEMLRNGLSFFPTTYQHAYPDYPASAVIIIYGFAKLFGTLNKFVAVLPTALCSALTLVMTFLIGNLHARRWGIYAVLFMFLTLTFVTGARSISLDIYPVLITTTSFYLIAALDKVPQSKRIYIIYALFFLGFLFRGPIGLIIPAGVVCSYYLLNQEYKKALITGALATFLLIVCTAALLLLAKQIGGNQFMHAVLQMQISGRINNPYQPWFFYFTDSLKMYALTYPLALLVTIGAVYTYFFQNERSQSLKFILQLMAWVAVILLGMTIPDDKKARYVLAIAPAISLLSAYIFIAPEKQKYFAILRWLLNTLFLSVPILFLIGILYLHQYSIAQKLELPVHYVCLFIGFSVLQIANLSIYRRHQEEQFWRETLILCVAAISFVSAIIAIAEPIKLYLDQSQAFVASVEKYRLQQHANLIFYKESSDGTPIKYLINMSSTTTPIFLANTNDLLNSHDPAIYVTSSEYFFALDAEIKKQIRIINEGKLGHIKVTVFEKV